MEEFEKFNSQWGRVKVRYSDGKITVVLTHVQQTQLGRAEIEEIMQEYLDNMGEQEEAGMAFEYTKGYYTARVSENGSVW